MAAVTAAGQACLGNIKGGKCHSRRVRTTAGAERRRDYLPTARAPPVHHRKVEEPYMYLMYGLSSLYSIFSTTTVFLQSEPLSQRTPLFLKSFPCLSEIASLQHTPCYDTRSTCSNHE